MKAHHFIFIDENTNKEKRFSVAHNLHTHGLNIEAAFYNWLTRTHTFTKEDFCEYVVSKDPINLKCKPK